MLKILHRIVVLLFLFDGGLSAAILSYKKSSLYKKLMLSSCSVLNIVALPGYRHRILYGVDLDGDSVIAEMSDGSWRRYPNKEYAIDPRIADLYYAVAHGDLDRVKYLIEKCSVDYTICSDFKITLLMHACKNIQAAVVEYLLKLPRIDVKAQDIMGYTALFHIVGAVAKEGHLEFGSLFTKVEKIFFLLKIAGLDFDYKPNRDLGRTALELALARSNKNQHVSFVARLLLHVGARNEVSDVYKSYLKNITTEYLV